MSGHTGCLRPPKESASALNSSGCGHGGSSWRDPRRRDGQGVGGEEGGDDGGGGGGGGGSSGGGR